MSKLIRISESAFEMLRQLELESGDSKQTIIETALEKSMRENLIKKGNEAYEKLRQNPQAWAEELAEREAWEQTNNDGLEDL
jgi:hypothetical protein